MEGAQLTLSAQFLAELLKLVGISLSRDTDTRKDRSVGGWTPDNGTNTILYFILIEILHPPALARAKAFLQQSVNSFRILGERCLTCFPLCQ